MLEHAFIEYLGGDGVVLFELVDELKETLIVLMGLSLDPLLDVLVGKLTVGEDLRVLLLSLLRENLSHLAFELIVTIVRLGHLGKGSQAGSVVKEHT